MRSATTDADGVSTAARHSARGRLRARLAGLACALGLGGLAAGETAAQGSQPGAGRSLPGVEALVCGAPRVSGPAPASASRFDPGAADAAAPWMAKLEVVEQIRPDGSMTISNCGASALNSQWLVTAAHCVGSVRWVSVRATLGARELSHQGAVRRTADVALCHARFDAQTLAHDIALVRLAEPLPANFPTLRLASRNEGAALRSGHSALSAGWSRLDRTRLSSTLRRARVRVVDPARRADGMIVAAPERHEGSLCVGESGGPLVADLGGGPVLVGVFSSVDAYQDAATGRLVELCDGFEARSYFTPTAGLARWAAQAIAACEADLGACLGTRRPAAMRVTRP